MAWRRWALAKSRHDIGSPPNEKRRPEVASARGGGRGSALVAQVQAEPDRIDLESSKTCVNVSDSVLALLTLISVPGDCRVPGSRELVVVASGVAESIGRMWNQRTAMMLRLQA
uniref:Uncharacterized protein n=1 Tax=Ralstonia solanacearum TaxID=305 RepID=A0A0S4TS10_RALSL|nr:conserved protein of unknown function [Ralstonia solanacearum]